MCVTFQIKLTGRNTHFWTNAAICSLMEYDEWKPDIFFLCIYYNDVTVTLKYLISCTTTRV